MTTKQQQRALAIRLELFKHKTGMDGHKYPHQFEMWNKFKQQLDIWRNMAQTTMDLYREEDNNLAAYEQLCRETLQNENK